MLSASHIVHYEMCVKLCVVFFDNSTKSVLVSVI